MITKDDLKKLTYEEYGKILDSLTRQVQVSSVHFDLIVPILRSGAATATHLAAKLGVVAMSPAQYKYMYAPSTHITQLFKMPKLTMKLPTHQNILIVDTNTVHGGIASKVIADTKDLYPNATLFFASACLDASMTNLDHVKQIFYGVLSNESRKLSRAECEKRGISWSIRLFPWENLEEEWVAISA